MRILIVTDAWHPQVNGVVRSLEHLAESAPRFGDEIVFVTPDRFRTFAMPGYNEIRLSVARPQKMAAVMDEMKADAVHIATEGPLGLLATQYCRKRGIRHTTCYHTRYPQYMAARAPIPERVTYALLRRFHNAGAGTMVATESLATELREKGFERLMLWSRGVDAALFRPREEKVLDLPGPIFLCVARLAVEKNLEAFLGLDLPGSKVMVGDGPDRARLEAAYPDVTFLGARFGEELAALYAAADVFVFPSVTETFGLVLLEALASGTPVAAFPGAGLIGEIAEGDVGIVDADLGQAARAALAIPASRCREFALKFSFDRATQQFLTNVRGALSGGG